LTKLEGELHHLRWVKRIWRVPYPLDCGWKFFMEELKTDNDKLLKENKKLSVKLRKAFSEIRYLDGYIATMNSDAKIRKIMDSEDEDEE
jgi:hypothetical protein